MAKLNEFGEDLYKKTGGVHGIKSLGAAVGMPDKEDKKNIQIILRNYEREFPGQIMAVKKLGQGYLQQSRDSRRAAGKLNSKTANITAMVDSDSNRTYDMELPPLLGHRLEQYIPTLFRDRAHYRWFKQNFPQLLLVDPKTKKI